MKFKKGDKVLCIEGHPPRLVEGRVYTIKKSVTDSTPRIKYTVEEEEKSNGVGWYEERFVSYKEYKVKKLLECLRKA